MRFNYCILGEPVVLYIHKVRKGKPKRLKVKENEFIHGRVFQWWF